MKVESIYVLIIHLLLLSGCGSPTPPPTPSPEPTITQPPAPTSPVVIVVTTYPKLQLPTATARAATIEPTATPAPTLTTTPTVPAPKFSNAIRFSADEPDLSQTREVFLYSVQQIFAMWDYKNMDQGRIIRRDWYYNDELWLTREELWDLDRWGTEGTVSDISVYDFESGLEPGVYRLELYIDGEAQFSDKSYQNRISFRILEERQSDPLPSLNGTRSALILPPDTLMIQETSGQQREFVTAGEISTLKWFPDNQHLVYGIFDRRYERLEYAGTSMSGIRHQLWVINGLTGEQFQLGSSSENLRTPIISPDGRYVATRAGSGYGDACGVDWRLTIIELDDQFGRRVLHNLNDFAGLTMGSGYLGAIPTTIPGIHSHGFWPTNTQFIVGLKWYCTTPDPRGIYRLDITTLTAEKIGDLEKP